MSDDNIHITPGEDDLISKFNDCDIDVPGIDNKRIIVVGVGGGGNNAVDHMLEQDVKGVSFVNVNTDAQQLKKSLVPTRVLIGPTVTRGRGAGNDPSKANAAAEESAVEISKIFTDSTDMVFITSGMGGGTGTGAAPIVADLAHEAGILTVGVVTKPFKFEGANRMRQAEQGIADLNGKVDSLIIIPNDRLKYVTDQKITFANAFGIADDVLKQAVTSISELVGFCKNVIINLDFADVSAVMKDAGRAHMGVGTASGREKAEQAATAAVSSPLLETSINGATGVLVNVTGSSEMTLDDVETAAGIVQEAANPDANIIFGATIAEEFQDEMRVTVIATGFDMKPESFAPKAAAGAKTAPSSPSFVPEDIDTPVAAAKQPTKSADMSDIDEIFSIFKR